MSVKRIPAIVWSSVFWIGLAGCSGGGSGGGGLAQRDLAAPAAVASGEMVTWDIALGTDEQAEATVFDANNAVVYHRDYGAGEFQWAPFQPGTYFVNVGVKDDTGPVAMGQALVDVTPRGAPMLTDTSHPLVALYTYVIPAGREGNVTYTCESCVDTVARAFETPVLQGTGSEVGVLLPGLRPNSEYAIQHTIYNGGSIEERGPELDYTSGAIDASLPTVEVLTAPVNPGINALLGIGTLGGNPIIADERGAPVWYLSGAETLFRPTGSGWTLIRSPQEFAVVDFTGQSIANITVPTLNAQLAARGFPATASIHHEGRPLPDGRFAIFGIRDQLITDLQGPGAVDVLGDSVIVLDDQMRVVWTWDSFDHLDLSRKAQLNDVQADGVLGIHLQFGLAANDWTHMNSIDYDPKDGNLILSVRHQSWIIKIAYENGNGDGHIIWRLGEGGDFTIISDDPSPWFSYQHDANLLADGRIAVYDNGNLRLSKTDGGNSRGQVYIIDEVSRMAMLDVNVDIGLFSPFLGSAALAPDGSYNFNSGPVGMYDMISKDGILHGSFHTVGVGAYRSFSMSDPFDTSSN